MKLRNLLLMLCSVLLSSCGVGNIEESSQEVTKENVSITFEQYNYRLKYIDEKSYVVFCGDLISSTTLEFPYNYYLSSEELDYIMDHKVNYVIPELPSWGGYYFVSAVYLYNDTSISYETLGNRYLIEDLTVYFSVS